MVADVMLVHGAWHGSWCWETVIERLADAGVRATAIDLPSAGSAPTADLFTDAACVRDALDSCVGRIVLVGHSYGGAVVTQAGDHPAVAHVVYIAAFPLADGERVTAAAADEPGIDEIDHSGRPDLGAAITVDPNGASSVDPALAVELFYNDCTPDQASAAVARLRRQAMAAFSQSPTVIAWRHRPSTYAIC